MAEGKPDPRYIEVDGVTHKQGRPPGEVGGVGPGNQTAFGGGTVDGASGSIDVRAEGAAAATFGLEDESESRTLRFLDRVDAGRRLAERLKGRRTDDLLVLGLLRGGVVVGHEIARALDAELDVLVVRKIGAPVQPELAVGSVAPGVIVLRDDVIAALGMSRHEVEELAAQEVAQLESYERRYRRGRPAPTVRGRRVVVVDDGIATGATATAALRSVKREEPSWLALAAPVCAPDASRALRAEADEVVCLTEPPDLHAIGSYDEEFGPVPDKEVIELLADRPKTR
jgi:putative phosphoribosyl transferase